jgi:hypothetical protein
MAKHLRRGEKLGWLGHPDLRWWMFVPILSCLSPFIIVGGRFWEEKKG